VIPYDAAFGPKFQINPGDEADRTLVVQRTKLLPCRPLWPGFAVNSVIFGTSWLVLLCIFLGPGFFIQSHRAKRGCCVRCGYGRRHYGGDQCSECGAEVHAI